MRSPQPEPPRLFSTDAGELPLSGPALLGLMGAVLARGVSFRFRARGWSMVPFIRDGDVITVEPLGSNRAGVGEVLAFIHPTSGKLVVHRMVAKVGTLALIQGDNFPERSDGLVPLENLLGRVTRIERSGSSVWLGLGLERYLIAWLSRAKMLTPLRCWLAGWRRRFADRFGG